MSNEGKRRPEVDRLDFEGRQLNLARTRQTSTLIKPKLENTSTSNF